MYANWHPILSNNFRKAYEWENCRSWFILLPENYLTEAVTVQGKLKLTFAFFCTFYGLRFNLEWKILFSKLARLFWPCAALPLLQFLSS